MPVGYFSNGRFVYEQGKHEESKIARCTSARMAKRIANALATYLASRDKGTHAEHYAAAGWEVYRIDKWFLVAETESKTAADAITAALNIYRFKPHRKEAS